MLKLTNLLFLAFSALVLSVVINAHQLENNRDIIMEEKKENMAADSLTVAVIKTKYGNIEIELYTSDAPKTTRNFVELAQQGYYNGIIFHRVAKGFVIQGGDSTGTGSGGKSIYGGMFEDELNPETQSYKEGYVRGTVAMANKGPNTNTSQFFVMLSDVPQMPKNYTIFGKVINGMAAVDSIAAQEIIPQIRMDDGRPVDPVVMESVTIEKRERPYNNIFDIK